MKRKRFLAILLAFCLTAGLCPAFPLTASAADKNGYGSEIAYAPQPLLAGGKPMMLFDYSDTALRTTMDMNSAQERAWLARNGYNLNGYGQLYRKYSRLWKNNREVYDDDATNVVAPAIFDGKIYTKSKTDDYKASYKFPALLAESGANNIRKMLDKGDISYAFAWRVYVRQYDKQRFMQKAADMSSFAWVIALQQSNSYDGSSKSQWMYKNYLKSNGKLSLRTDSWVKRYSWSSLSIEYQGYSTPYNNNKVLDTRMEDGILLGKDSQGPSILSVDVQKSLPESDSDHYYDKRGSYNYRWSVDPSITKADIGESVYISVQFDEPVKFIDANNDGKPDGVDLSALELQLQVTGQDGSSAMPVAAKFLRYTPDPDTGAPSMIFEYVIQNPDDPEAPRKDRYLKFDSLVISQNNNSMLFNNLTDIAGNRFGARGGIQQPSGVTKAVEAPLVDLLPFKVESIEVHRVDAPDKQYAGAYAKMEVTLHLNKPINGSPGYDPQYTYYAPSIKLNTGDIQPDYMRVSHALTKASVNSPERSSYTYAFSIPWRSGASDGPLTVESLELKPDIYEAKDKSGYTLSTDLSGIAPKQNYYIDTSAPQVDVAISSADTGIYMVQADIRDASVVAGSTAVFSIETDLLSENPMQYQISTDGSYDAGWVDATAGKAFSVTTPVIGASAYLFVKLPDLAEISKIKAYVSVIDAAGNRGGRSGEIITDFDSNPPMASLENVQGGKGISAVFKGFDYRGVSYTYAFADGIDAARPGADAFEPGSSTFEAGKEGRTTITYDGDLSANMIHQKTLWVVASDGTNERALSLNIEYDNVHGEIDFVGGVPEDPAVLITDASSPITLEAELKNVKWYTYAFVEYEEYEGKKGISFSIYDDEALLHSVMRKLTTEGGISRVDVPDDDVSDSIYTNTVIKEFTLDQNSDIYVLGMYEEGGYYMDILRQGYKAPGLSRPVYLVVAALDADDKLVFKSILLNTYYAAGGADVEQTRYSTNGYDGNRVDVLRTRSSDTFPGFSGLPNAYDADADSRDFNRFTGRIDPFAHPLNIWPMYGFAQAEFSLAQAGVSGLAALDLANTKLYLKKITYDARLVEDYGSATMRYIPEDGWTFVGESGTQTETLQSWTLSEDMIMPAGGRYTFVVDVDTTLVDPVAYFTDETGTHMVRYEFWFAPSYVGHGAMPEKKVSIFTFQNDLPEITVTDIHSESGDERVDFISEAMQPFAADLANDGGDVKDASVGVPTVRVRALDDGYGYAFPEIKFAYALPLYTMKLLCPYGKNYQMIIAGKDGLKADDGKVRLDGMSRGSFTQNYTHFYWNEVKELFGSSPRTGDVVSVYYQFYDSNNGQRSPIYRIDLVYDETPPTVDITLSEEGGEARNVYAYIRAYDGHTANDGEGDYFAVDTPADRISLAVTAEYEDGTAVDPQEDGSYLFERNGSITVVATDGAGNETTVTKTITNIDADAPVIAGTPVIDRAAGKFTLTATVPDADAVTAFLKFDEAYTAHLLGVEQADIGPDDAFVVTETEGSIPGAAASSFEGGVVTLEVYAKDGVPLTTATLIVIDAAGNMGELVMDLNIDGLAPEVTNADKTYTYGGTLDFSVPVMLPDFTNGLDGEYASAHGGLGIYADGETEVRFWDLFGREYYEMITADIFGGSHTFTLDPETPTNGDVEVTIKTAEGFTVNGRDTWTATVTGNGTVDYTVNGAGGAKSYSMPISNIDRTPPEALYIREINGMETFDEAGKPTVAGSVTYSILGFSEKGVRLLEDETGAYTFTGPGGHTFHFVDAAGNAGALTVSEADTAFMPLMDLAIAKCRLVYTTGGSDPIQLGIFEPGDPELELSVTNSDVAVRIEALNAAGEVVPAVMAMGDPVEGVRYYGAQSILLFTQNATATVTVTSSSGSAAEVTVGISCIDKTPPAGSVEYVMMDADETLPDGTILKKGAAKAYLVAYEADIASVWGEGVRRESGGTHDGRYYIYFEENGSGTFYLEDAAGNVGTVVVGAYGIDITAPQSINESWFSSINAKPDADPYTSGNSKEEVLGTPTNNSIRLLFTFSELIGSVDVAAYLGEGDRRAEAPDTADYIRYTISGTMLMIEFRQNCQARIVVSDIRGNSVTLWRPEDGPITVIDKDAPAVTGETRQVQAQDNKVTIAYSFSEPVTRAGEEENFRDAHAVAFDENGVFPITFADKANNVVTVIAVISEIDDQSPEISYALQITPGDAGIVFSDPANTQVAATNGNVEIAVGAEDANGAAIEIINQNSPNIPLTLNAPTITNDSRLTKAVTAAENGIYVIKAADRYGNTNTLNVRINFIDKEAPVISTDSNRAVEIELASANEAELKAKLLAGVTARDNRDGDVPVSVDVSGVIAAGAAGTYTVAYSASDSLGNVGTKPRTVSVLAKARKALTINGRSIAENDIFATYSREAAFDMSRLAGYKLYAAEGYKTRAQMKYAAALEGTSLALPNDGYYTILAKNGEMDAFLVYIFVY